MEVPGLEGGQGRALTRNKAHKFIFRFCANGGDPRTANGGLGGTGGVLGVKNVTKIDVW